MGARKSPEQFAKEVYDLVGDEYQIITPYVTSKEKILMRHTKCNYTYPVKPNSFLNGNRCPKCYGTPKKSQEEFEREVYELYGNEYTVIGKYISSSHKIAIRHNKCGKTRDVLPTNFLNGSGCFYCSYKLRAKEDSLGLEKFSEYVTKVTNGEYTVVGKYKNNKTPIDIRHNVCNHITPIRPNDFKSKHIRCHFCYESYGEHALEVYLNKNNISYISQKKFDKCINPSTGRKLPFDFFLPDYHACIEFDGKQHFEPIEYFGGEKKFKSQQLRDHIKTEFCRNNHIFLLRIPYFNLERVNKFVKALQAYVYYFGKFCLWIKETRNNN